MNHNLKNFRNKTNNPTSNRLMKVVTLHPFDPSGTSILLLKYPPHSMYFAQYLDATSTS